MNLHTLKPNEGARKKRKRVGRGTGSGHGKTSGRGSKGQNSRSGGGVRPGFEGGQLPLFQRIPKRGFKNPNRLLYNVVNIEDLNVFEENTVVTPELLLSVRLISKPLDGIKILGNGAIEKKLTVKAHKFSKAAETAIKNIGGTVEVV